MSELSYLKNLMNKEEWKREKNCWFFSYSFKVVNN